MIGCGLRAQNAPNAAVPRDTRDKHIRMGRAEFSSSAGAVCDTSAPFGSVAKRHACVFPWCITRLDCRLVDLNGVRLCGGSGPTGKRYFDNRPRGLRSSTIW